MRPEGLLEAVLDALPEPVFVLSRDGVYVEVLGGRDTSRYHDGHPLVGKRLADVLPPEVAAGFLGRIATALDTGEVAAFDYQLSQAQVAGVAPRDGVPDVLWFQGHVAPLAPVADRDDLVVWLAFNVTQRQQLLLALDARQAELERLARTDPLTELCNRRSFLAAVDHELRWTRRTGEPSALVVLDIDHFKRVNDTRGHAGGDQVLRAVARLLTDDRRGTDVVGRLGGEEFALLIRGADLATGVRLAARLRRALETDRIVVDDELVPVTASFGVAVMRRGDADIDTVMRRADDAMYLAKRRGRNRVVAEGGGHLTA